MLQGRVITIQIDNTGQGIHHTISAWRILFFLNVNIIIHDNIITY